MSPEIDQQQSAQVLDVRDAGERRPAHALSSLIARHVLDARIHELPRSAPTHVIGRSGQPVEYGIGTAAAR